MNRLKSARVFPIFLLLLSACLREEPTRAPAPSPSIQDPTATVASLPTDTAVPEDPPIYLSIIWHQHQPVYYKDPETGFYVRPWVRLHATKDYVDMAAILEDYPNIRVTFNLTPSLIRQLDDLSTGAKDIYQALAEVEAEDLTDEEKLFILGRFFDINRKIIDRYPRYRELLQLRDESQDPMQVYSIVDFRDLQVLFNLAWVDPDWLAEEPLRSLVEKGENFTEEDKEILFAEHLRLIQDVIPVHRRLLENGQIDVTMTPFAHPILPLLVTTDLAREALPDLGLPSTRFVYGQDAVAQVESGVQLYLEHFGRPPRGMWPAEGAVAQEIITMVSKSGIEWMASDEGVLANSLGIESFTRDQDEVVVEADRLYRPYYVQGRDGDPVAMVFRDVLLSDKVGFTYSGLDGETAAADLIQRIHAIREKLIVDGVEGPRLVSVILDGENAWENYDNDGKSFLLSLYRRLSEDPLIVTITPGDFVRFAPEQPTIDDLWAGSWINHDFSTWIGEDEENTAWEFLTATREYLQRYISGSRKGDVSDQVLSEAMQLMFIAEGSDWFWWYGSDQNSGNDDIFDQQFRDTLKQIYLTLGDQPPNYLEVPIIPLQAVTADRASSGLITPKIDGLLGEDEWAAAGMYYASGSVIAAAQPAFNSLAYGFDIQNIYLGISFMDDLILTDGESQLEIYLKVPGGGETNNFTRIGSLLGFPADKLLSIQIVDGNISESQLFTAASDQTWEAITTIVQVSLSDNQIEIAVPLASLGNTDSGDRLTVRAFFSQELDVAGTLTQVDIDQVPSTGPADLAVPDLGNTTLVLDVPDPEGDDYGPGSYIYPLDPVFAAGNFDVINFQVGSDEDEIVFKFILRGPVENSWDSPNGLSLQTIDVYIDKDKDGQGGATLLPGRNLSLSEGYTWDFALTAEGWAPGIFIPGEDGPQQIATSSEFLILVDPGQREVTVRVPKTILGEDPEAWQIAAVVLSQEGFPSSGVMRVRDVLPAAEQWRIGGALLNSTNHTRVIDIVWPVEGDQEGWLSDFLLSDAPQSDLSAGDFARIPMINRDMIP